MIFEVYVIFALSGMSLIDNTYRKIHLGVTNSLVSGLLHTIYTMFEVEMEIGFVKIKKVAVRPYFFSTGKALSYWFFKPSSKEMIIGLSGRSKLLSK